MNTINASNPTLNNILTMMNSGNNIYLNTTQPKKRPTFNEVYNKIKKRTDNLNPTKHPINNILTNEQLFRFYIQDTQPLLLKSNEAVNTGVGLSSLIGGQRTLEQEQNPDKIYGVADVGNMNELSNTPQSRDYVDNPNAPTAPIASYITIPFDDMTDTQKQQFAYDNSLKILDFFNNINLQGNASQELGTLFNAMLMRDAFSEGWRSFGYDLFNDLYGKGMLEGVITELYSVMTRAKAENPDTYELITDTFYNIMRQNVDGLSRDELEEEVFRYIQNRPPYYGYARGATYQGELAKYQATADRTPNKYIEAQIKALKQMMDGTSTQVPEETPTPELKDPSTRQAPPEITPEQQANNMIEDILKNAMSDLFQDEATANETLTSTERYFTPQINTEEIDPSIKKLMEDMLRTVKTKSLRVELVDTPNIEFNPYTVRASDLLLPTDQYNQLPEHLKPFYKPANAPRRQYSSTPPIDINLPPLPSLNLPTLNLPKSDVVEPRVGGGRPKGAKNKTTLRKEAEMRQLNLDLPQRYESLEELEVQQLIDDIFS